MHETGERQIGETISLAAVAMPEGVTLLDDVEETVVATLSPPRLQVEEEVEAETELVGEGEEPSEEAEPSEGAADEGPSGEE
jgi:large subunit ribosomal protein L25